ncbi:peptidoglycan-recognition protein LC-like [Periplaneta americana]|uniref:peptidoglycan-recognition protein LC-like n=1 Tax=Periplaneta americana TaxID=6978 RepID=UPI0037E7FA84
MGTWGLRPEWGKPVSKQRHELLLTTSRWLCRSILFVVVATSPREALATTARGSCFIPTVPGSADRDGAAACSVGYARTSGMVERRREADRVEGNDGAQGPNEEREWSGHDDSDDDDESALDVYSDDDGEDGDLKTDCASATNAIVLAAQKSSESRPSFGSIVVNSSSDVHFGNKTFYNGPVTIKQFVYTTRNGNADVNDSEDGENGPCADIESSADPVSGALSNGKDYPTTPASEKDCETVNGGVSPQVNGSLLPIWQNERNEQATTATRKSVVTQWMRTRRCLVIGVTAGACAIVLLVTLLLTLPSRAIDSTTAGTNDHEDGLVSAQFKFNATDNIPSGKLKFVNRREWLAQPPLKKGTKLHHPLPLVVILHTATEGCSTQAECVFLVRHTQTFHIESNGWDDIGYSFLVGGDASVYVGRGWDTQGAFAYGYNNRSIGIAFIGTFIDDVPVPKQIAAGLQLIQQGVQLGKIAKDYKVMAHRQLSATESPGLAFYEIIKTWDHWAEKF